MRYSTQREGMYCHDCHDKKGLAQVSILYRGKPYVQATYPFFYELPIVPNPPYEPPVILPPSGLVMQHFYVDSNSQNRKTVVGIASGFSIFGIIVVIAGIFIGIIMYRKWKHSQLMYYIFM